jgi:hypothetical protein
MEYRPPYGHALAAGAAVLLLYIVTLAPTTWFWDASEYIATAHILGIPHPPGNPLFVVLGRSWSVFLGLFGLSIPVRINLLAAMTSATASAFLFLMVWRILRGWMDSEASLGELWARRLPIIGAWAGAILGSTAYTVWNQSNVNEKVYTVSVLVIAIVSWLALRWRDRKDEPNAGWYLVLALYIMVLGSTNHLMSLLPAPALGLLILMEKPGILLDRRVLTRGVLAVVLGLSFNFFLPLRSAEQPIINEGEPVCETIGGAAVAVFTVGRAGCPALAANLTREQYGGHSVFSDPTSDPFNPDARPLGLIAHQYYNYFQYFDWQWARGLANSPVPGNSRLPVTLLFLGLGVWGLVLTGRSQRGHLVYLGTLTATLTLALVFYLNFRYGYSLAPHIEDRALHEVRERDYFYIASFHLWGFLAGMGLVGAWRWVAGGKAATTRSLSIGAPLLAIAFIPLVFNFAWADRSDDYSARDWAWNLLQSVEPYGILFTNGDNDTFPLWYLQEVEGIRQDVSVVVVQYLYTDWYPRQLVHHTVPERQRPFDPSHGGIWEAPETPPSNPVTTLSTTDLNSIRSGTLQEAATFDLGQVALQFPAGTWLGRGERVALALIRDSLGERPIHFASTGGLAQSLGMDRWAVRQGLSAQLRIEDLEEDENVVRVDPQVGGEWIDREVSYRLSEEVHSYRGLADREIWPDRATLNIPWQFYFFYMQLADLERRTEGDPARVEHFMDRAQQFLVTAQGGSRGTP